MIEQIVNTLKKYLTIDKSYQPKKVQLYGPPEKSGVLKQYNRLLGHMSIKYPMDSFKKNYRRVRDQNPSWWPKTRNLYEKQYAPGH